MEKKLFGMTMEQIKRQSSLSEIKPDMCQTPIRPGETLEPCIRGARKILEDPHTKEMMYKIYRGID